MVVMGVGGEVGVDADGRRRKVEMQVGPLKDLATSKMLKR